MQILAGASDLSRLRRDAIDALVVAGGDGTVSQAAGALVGGHVPMAILPLGTANNIAVSLGLDRPLPELIAGWPAARRRALDVGMARGDWGERLFLEAVGTGLIPWGMAAVDAEKHPAEGDEVRALADP